MPNTGFRSISVRITGTAYSPVAAGSPGPLERKMPSGLSARMSAADVCAGTTVTLQRIAGELAQNIALDAVVDRNNVEFRRRAFRRSLRPIATASPAR